MVRKLILICLLFQVAACGELQDVVNKLPGDGPVSEADIAAGLRQALDIGIEKQVSKLAQTNGFFGNPLVKIVLPEELKKVDKALRDIGMGDLADEGLKLLNRAAEEAVAEATPIFVDAVKNITFKDAKEILLGGETAATSYLRQATRTQLYDRFQPVIRNSFEKVGAEKVWSTLISRYNSIPFTNEVNPDLTDYVTLEALDGVFTMIAVEEKEIRASFSSRTTALLRKVFALQD